MSLFASCNEADLKLLLQAPHKLNVYRKGQVVIERGTPCLSLMVLLSGKAESRLGGDEGREVIVESFRAPRLLAPIFLFAQDNTMPVEVRADDGTEVLFINREAFFEFMRAHPSVLRAFLGMISERGRFLSDKVRSFATKNLQSRISEYLEIHGGISSVAMAAEHLGVKRPSLSRVLAKMLAEGSIKKDNSKRYILIKK